jgi:hypothetical protein
MRDAGAGIKRPTVVPTGGLDTLADRRLCLSLARGSGSQITVLDDTVSA